ncbi:MAG: hypothetical protein KF890_15435, partial [Nitrospira sp.]|nr:hypothetical protein [Nitrospira sp.]
MILGPMMEEYLRRAMLISRGDATVFLLRPISATLLALSVAAVLLVAFPAIRRKRDEALQD